jgi:hypothetical protein
MPSIITVLLGIFFFLFANTATAKTYASRFCANDSQFTCYTVKRDDTWNKLFTDPTERDLVMRINRMNTPLIPGMKIAIPNNLDANLIEFSPFQKRIDPSGKKVMLVSINDLAFGAYNEQGDLEHWGPISTGRGYCPDVNRACHTPTGKFAVYRKGGAHCVSTKFPVGRGGAPMPYCMFFKGGFALHGSYQVPGYHDSHGCIRLFVNDAKWLNQEFTQTSNEVVVIIKK